jgi:membrane protease YdiL (CAAX protease family)|nr:CPBP family intramembrane glutamic endopeptidase [Candidatus Krumholzibacteria bacterium]
MGVLDLAVLLVLVVAVPLSGVLEFRLLNRWIRAGRTQARLRFYAWVIGFEWALTLGLLVGWFNQNRGLEPLGLVPAVSEFQWLAVVAGLGLTYLVIMQMNAVLEDDEALDKVQSELDKLSRLAPRTDTEQQMFLWLSVTAGICEEILYRGLLMSVLTPLLGWFPALLTVAVIFGLGHAYQGWEGMGKTALVGLALGLLAWFSGSLYVGMILHAVLDLTSGRILQAAWLHRVGGIYLDE